MLSLLISAAVMTSLSLQSLLASWQTFTQQLDLFAAELGLSSANWQCDHAALRVNDIADAKRLVIEFCEHGEVISNNIINGRPIYIIKLNTPLMWHQQAIDCIELPFPNDKVYPKQGWEHVELIVPESAHSQNCQQLAEQIIRLQPQLAPLLANDPASKTAIKIKHSSPQGEHERLANPTIAFKKQQLCIKLHAHHIETILQSEQSNHVSQ